MSLFLRVLKLLILIIIYRGNGLGETERCEAKEDRQDISSASRDFPCADFSHVRLMPAFSKKSVEIKKPIGSNQDPLVNVIRVSKGEWNALSGFHAAGSEDRA